MASPNLQIQGGNFQDSEGNVLNLGYLLLELSHDESYASGPAQICAGIKFRVNLNSSGSIPTSPAVMVYSNDVLTPAGSFYIVRAFKADGTEAWASEQIWNLSSSPNPLDVGTIVPASPPGTGLSGAGASTLLLETNSAVNTNQALLNLANGTNVTITNSAGTTTINATGGGTFSTSGQGWLLGPGITDVSATIAGFNAAITNYSANTVLVQQFALQSSWKLTGVSYRLQTTAASSHFNFGIYNSAGSKLIDSGAFDGSISTLQTNTFTGVTLAPGTYYFACSATSTTPTGPALQVGTVIITNFLSAINAVNPIIATAANATSGNVMPATLGTLTAASSATFQSFPLCVWTV